MLLPLFPLSVCILPGGFTQLRIFEIRYQRLVKESLHNELGFGVCMLDEDKQTLLPIGTRCKIIDFETLEDGLLGITISGIERFKLEHFTNEKDGLKRGKVTILPGWDPIPIANNQQKLTQVLRELMTHYPTHLTRYNIENFNDLAWICQRWLEILPLPAIDKQHCIAAKDHRLALSMLDDLLQESDLN
ncbi:LON peptidase substrate-binding domain-containing protein [Shewanella sp. Isolate13]|uniref:LON peptidase substrate-binding domain-containing protein n=1 Tax=Shewanella sp. Isolate13 TaxID=2908531 RepID=UPI001EFE5D86|nr:LON peptidase substrate-binding domain-containing protein [Shewanella sp. Isolate13]MCG9729344.1 LON peptidase substrate-binding domain-containing protein [Shewanella sp. Isolate13]